MTPEQARAEWERCAPLLAPALERAYGTHDLEDVWSLVQAGAAQFWPGEGSAMVTELFVFPKRKALNFWLIGGVLPEILAMRPHIEAWGLAQGCTLFTGAGRAGFGRAMREHGYRTAWTAVVKEIGDHEHRRL